ncbi:MAG: hypothetical protein KAW19_00265 [Candidatus Aminicenantes bacterium]|nr:hypothetical protein [Candidatus Aminicenantes bacterium]
MGKTKKEIKKEKENFEERFKKEKNAIIEQMLGSKDIESRLQMFLFTSIDDLRKSTEKSSKAANKLFIILIILTGVLAFGTIVGLI